MAVREIDGVWVISSRQMYLPGTYDSARTARSAFKLGNLTLDRLASEINHAQQRPITADDIRAAKQFKPMP